MLVQSISDSAPLHRTQSMLLVARTANAFNVSSMGQVEPGPLLFFVYKRWEEASAMRLEAGVPNRWDEVLHGLVIGVPVAQWSSSHQLLGSRPTGVHVLHALTPPSRRTIGGLGPVSFVA